MKARRLLGDAQAAFEVHRDILLGRYPDFVTGGPLPKGQIPVFVFHSLDPESFGRKLAYLADNSYVALSAEEYFQTLMGTRAAPERAVLLTFDDGRGSLWSVGLPLLKRHGMKGVVFLIPGRIASRPGPLPPTWDDVREGRAEAAAVLSREAGDGALLSWEEIAAMSGSGLLDFESHTLLHSRIHAAPLLAGFMSPERRGGCDAMDIPLVHESGQDLLADEVPLGTPLLRSQPRTSESLRFFEDPAVRRACVELVAEEGGAGFFYRTGWERRLRRLLRHRPIKGRLETPEEREAALRRELAEARVRIEEHLGRPVTHLCYPWHAAGPTARRLAREAGYRTGFCGKVRGVPITPPGGDPQAIARIGEDYVELLPGRGRADLTTLLRRKWTRRLRGGA